MNKIWLASYPRSGNTLLRTILNHCFNLKSASFYFSDFKGNKKVENQVGHIEHSQKGIVHFPNDALPLVKTHEMNKDKSKAIYIIRDGRFSAHSLWIFWNKKILIEDVIKGKHRFGTWSDHVNSWNPTLRSDTLLIKYESILEDLNPVLISLSEFLKKDIIKKSIPSRESLAKIDGRYIRLKNNNEKIFSKKIMGIFDEINKSTMEKYGYF